MNLQNRIGIAWVALFVLALGSVFALAVFEETPWIAGALALGALASIAYLIKHYWQVLKSRSAAYGIQSVVTVILMIGFIGVINFLGARYPKTFDLTSNKIHTLSDQTEKVFRGLKFPVKATYFAKMGDKEKNRPFFDRLSGLSTQFQVEYVDPDKEPLRAKQAGLTKYGTLQLSTVVADAPRNAKVEEVTEEKVTNALIKLVQEKTTTLCAVTGHGEPSFSAADASGYETLKKSLESQAYVVREVNLLRDTPDGKVPSACDALAIFGPKSAWFEPEAKMLDTYLADGGRALVALDINLKGGEFAPELTKVLEKWNIKATSGLVVDQVAQMFGGDATVPIIASFSRDQAITKSFTGANCYFPFMRPIEIVAGAPASLNVQWIAQTTAKSWAVMNLASLTKGRIGFVDGQDKRGPLHAAVAAEGKLKDSKATRNTRLVVFGTSQFPSNQYSRFGNNLDLAVNALSWVLEDESLISIRAKEDAGGRVELSSRAGRVIFFLTVLIMPILIAAFGVVNWIKRKRL